MPSRGDAFAQGSVPARGEIVHLNGDPAIGPEIKGPHYGSVLSQDAFTVGTGLVVVSPVTSKIGKLSAFEFPIRAGRVNGVAILSLFRTLDYQARSIQYEGRIAVEHSDEAARRVTMVR